MHIVNATVIGQAVIICGGFNDNLWLFSELLILTMSVLSFHNKSYLEKFVVKV